MLAERAEWSWGGLTEIELGTPVGVSREAPVVVIPVYGQPELFERCIRSVLRNTSFDVPIVVADDATPDRSPEEVLGRLDREGIRHRVILLRQPQNLGFPTNVNTTFEASAPGDVVLLNSDSEVGPEWLERLRAAAYSDTLIATATALTNHGTILSVPERNSPCPDLPAGHTVDTAARAVAQRSLRLRPRIPTAIGHCVYIRRSALELVGLFDPAFRRGYGEEVDFSQRCALRGLIHVAADDVFVFHVGGASLGSENQEKHESELARRYPHYHGQVADASGHRYGPLARALLLATVALTGMSVTLDGRCLGSTTTGTQVMVLELARMLARSGIVELRVLVGPLVSAAVVAELEGAGITVLRSDDLPEDLERSTIAHRPYQVTHSSELALLDQLGERLVITHLDLIAYRTPDYAGTPEDSRAFRRLTRTALGLADAVLFISEHAASDAIADSLVDPARARVVHLGLDNPARQDVIAVSPSQLPAAAQHDFILYIGTDYRHKNRVFALELLDELQSRHDWRGYLVLAGPHAHSGTSELDEAEFLGSRPELAARVISLGEVSEGEKAWLYTHTTGVVYPSVYEGFGMIPFEAAAFGRPSFFAAQTALAEVLPASTATLVPWDVAQSADAVYDVLVDADKARALVAAVAAAGQRFTWEATTSAVLDAYAEVISSAPRDLKTIHDGVQLEDLTAFTDSVSRFGLTPEGKRALLSLLGRPWVRRPLVGLLTLAFRAGYLAKHRRLPGRSGI
jgi:GT2 family glycosyltransferase/glycosyltransferase involved in cell wall biosynthesis